MILSDDCYISNSCLKHKNGKCAKNSFCLFLFKLDKLFDESLLTTTQRRPFNLILDSDLSDEKSYTFVANIKRNINQFVKDGKNLYIYSSIPGNGKTSWAVKLLQTYLYNICYNADLRCHALFINVPRYLLELKNNISEKSDYISHIKNNVYDAEIVVWDDIATKVSTEFEHEHLLSIIDQRINLGKTNVFTSNIPPNDLCTLLGSRLASRVINTSNTVEFIGQDKRGVTI